MKEKACFKCAVVKPITEFYVHPAMGDGRLNKCKECTKKDVQKNYRVNHDHYMAYERRRRPTDKPCPRYASEEDRIAASKRSRQRYLQNNPIKRSAHVVVGNAIRDGKLARQPCEVCANPKSQAHHDNYSKPLDVRWLCTKHHAEWHKHNDPVVPDQSRAA